MAIDPTRAAFVKQAFRYESAEDTSIKTTYPQAREIVLETNMDTASAASLASTYFNAIKTPALAFQIEIEGVYQLEDFITSPPRFTCSFPEYATDGRTFTLVAIECDYLSNRSTLTVRG